MLTPWLVVVTFVIVLVVGGIGAVYGVLSGNAAMVGASVVAILTTRITLESVTVFFKIAEDVAQAKEVLFEMQEKQLLRMGGERDEG